MTSGRVVAVACAALVWSGIAAPALAQETKPTPDIRMLLTQPQGRVAPDATTLPDPRETPMPKLDKPPVQPPITIVVDDGRCYPGEDGPGAFGQANRRRRR